MPCAPLPCPLLTFVPDCPPQTFPVLTPVLSSHILSSPASSSPVLSTPVLSFPVLSFPSPLQVSLRYLGSQDSSALLALRALARVEVLRALGTSSTTSLDTVGPSLGLPPTLVEYLAGRD